MTPILLLFGAGLALILAEVLVPSMGLLGISAAACLIGSIVWAFNVSTDLGMNLLLAGGVLVPGAILLALRMLPRSPLTRRLTATGFSFEDGAAVDARDRDLLGRRGVVEATLRPAGVARIEGRRVDVVSRGQRIDAGTPIEVVELRGNRVVVAPVDAETPSPSAGTSPADPSPEAPA